MVLHYIWATISVVWEIVLEVVKSFIPNQLLPKENIQGEIALVTGAGSGIGRQLSLELGSKGCILVLWDFNESGNAETKQMIIDKGGRAIAYTVDVTNADNIRLTADKVREDVGDVTILVNNAGVCYLTGFIDQPEHLIKKTIEVNTLAPMIVTKAFLRSMLDNNHGYIVNISSAAGLNGTPGLVDYSSSKFGVYGFTEALDMELRYMNKSIHTLKVCPSMVKTPMTKGMADKSNPKFSRGSDSEKDYLTPEYVAEKTVKALQAKQSILILPALLHVLLVVRKFLPTSMYVQFLKATIWDTTELLD